MRRTWGQAVSAVTPPRQWPPFDAYIPAHVQEAVLQVEDGVLPHALRDIQSWIGTRAQVRGWTAFSRGTAPQERGSPIDVDEDDPPTRPTAAALPLSPAPERRGLDLDLASPPSRGDDDDAPPQEEEPSPPSPAEPMVHRDSAHPCHVEAFNWLAEAGRRARVRPGTGTTARART